MVDRLMHLRPHEAVTALAKEAEPQSAYAVLEGQARLFARWLGFAIEAEESVWTQFPPRARRRTDPVRSGEGFERSRA